jgi:hypothetical protein
LLYGADREIKCYLGRQPVDFVGECSTGIVSNTSNQGISSSSRPMNTRQNKSKDIEECMNLLTQSAFVPSPPMELLFDCHFSSEVVVRTVSTPMGNSPKRVGGEPSGDQGTGDAWSANMPKTTLIQQKIYKCLVNLTWTTPCSNGSMIDIYEVRYRMAEEENEELLDQKKRANNEEDNTDQEEDEEESNEQDDEEEASESAKKTKRTSSVANRLLASANASWRTERTNHTRHGLQQGIVLEGMQFNTWYEFMVRSWNSTGRGDWGKSFKFKTMISPGEVTTNSKEQVLQ